MRIGQKVRFDPFEGIKFSDVTSLRKEVTGTIVAINEKHKWFSVEYGNKMRTSFKFSDVGSVVTLIG